MPVKTIQLGVRVAGSGGSDTGIIAYNPNYPSAISRINWEKHGERPSVKDYGAKGDTLFFFDGGITASDTTFTSALAGFDADDVGKVICIAGAGTSGRALGTTIASVTSPTSIELTAAAVTTVSLAEFAFGTDDTVAFNDAVLALSAVGRSVHIPAATYMITDTISIVDCHDFGLFGDGSSSILLASQTLANGANLLDVSGSRRISLTSFCIDGRFAQRSTTVLSALYGDGTVDNPSYGDVTVQNVTMNRWEQQGFGVGANVGKTVSGVRYLDLDILNFGGVAEGAHPIDTGAGGTKIDFQIRGCRINWQQQPAAAPLNGLFCGHGKNYQFVIEGNLIKDCPYNAIQFFSRPFAGENGCEFRGVVCKGNIIINSGASSIALYGVKDAVVEGNTILNSGQSGAAPDRSGIYMAWGYSDGAQTVEDPCENVNISGNSLIDQTSSTMQYGILAAHATGAEHSGIIAPNRITGYVISPILVTPDDGNHKLLILAEAQGGARGLGIGMPTPRAGEGLGVRGDLRLELDGTNFSSGQTIFNRLLIESSGASGNYLMGLGLNIRFDTADTKWKSGFDGAHNAFAALMFTQSDGRIRFYSKVTTGSPSAAQEFTPVQFEQTRFLQFDPDGLIATQGADARFARSATETLFVSPSIESAAANFTVGLGMNVRYDSAASLWRSGNDGANNGFAAMLMSYGGGLGEDGAIRFFTKGRTGSTNQTATAVDFDGMERMRLTKNGYLGVGIPNPTARLHVVGSANAAPFKIEAGTLLTTAQDGSMEFDGSGLYFTVSGARRSLFGGLGMQIRVKGTGTAAEALDIYDIDQTTASSTLTIPSQPNDGYTVTINGTVYTFRNTISVAGDVARYPTAAECAYNLFAAINDVSAWEGYLYGAGTAAHSTCEAEPPIGSTVKVKFRTPGAGGNGTTVSASSPMSWSPSSMAGGSAGTAPHKYLVVQDGALTLKNNAFASLPIWKLYDNGDMRVYGGNTAPPADINFGIYGRTVIRFAQSGTEEVESGSIHHGGFGSAMNLVGMGSSGSNRIVRIYDHMGIGSSPPITATGGNLSVAGWIGVGTSSVTSGKIFEVVGGTARFAAGVEIVGALNMPSLTGDTLLGLDTGKNVVSATTIPIGVSVGGTGATTAGGALTNLGAAAASHSHNISDVTGGFTGSTSVLLSPSGSTTMVFNNGFRIS